MKLKVAETCDRLGMIPLIREVTITQRLRCLAILKYMRLGINKTWNPQNLHDKTQPTEIIRVRF